MFKKKRTTPLERISDREVYSLAGFTLLELLIVIVIVGVLATLGLSNLKPFKEKTLEKEVKASLSLISSAEKIYRMESGHYYPPSGIAFTSTINSELKLALTGTNWNYRIDNYTGTGFTGRGTRTNDSTKQWCVTESTGTPYACN